MASAPVSPLQSSSGPLQGQYMHNQMAGHVAGQMAGGRLNQALGAPVQQAQPLPLQQPMVMHQGLLQQQAQMMNQPQMHQPQMNQTYMGSMGPARVPNGMHTRNPQMSMQPY